MAKAFWYLNVKQLPPVKTDEGYKLYVDVSISKIYILALKIKLYFYITINFIKKLSIMRLFHHKNKSY